MGVRARLWTAGLLGAAVFASAIAVVVVKEESRKLFVELQGLERASDKLSVEWGQLQLEQSTWATDARIEEVARKKLDMVVPAPDDIVLVTP